jgi:hypothetical protein
MTRQPSAEPVAGESVDPARAALLAAVHKRLESAGPNPLARVVDAVLAELAARPGPVESAVRADLVELTAAVGGTLTGGRASQAEIACRMARVLDLSKGEGAVGLSGAAAQLAAALDRLWKGVRVVRPSDRFAAGLSVPVGRNPELPAEVRDPA